jgi:hypothetical protein
MILNISGKRSPEDQFILVSICVGSALTLGLVIFVVVHGGRQLKRCNYNCTPNCPQIISDNICWRHNNRRRWCCDNDVIADVTSSEMVSSPDQASFCSCVVHSTQPKAPCNIQHLDYNYSRDFEFFHPDFNNTVNTKSSFLTNDEDDYFLSLSKDRRFLTTIPVSEL